MITEDEIKNIINKIDGLFLVIICMFFILLLLSIVSFVMCVIFIIFLLFINMIVYRIVVELRRRNYSSCCFRSCHIHMESYCQSYSEHCMPSESLHKQKFCTQKRVERKSVRKPSVPTNSFNVPTNLSNLTSDRGKCHEHSIISTDSNIFTIQGFLSDVKKNINNDIEYNENIESSDIDIDAKEIVYDVISTKDVARFRPLSPITIR